MTVAAGESASPTPRARGMIFKVLGLLLTYPESELLEALGELRAVVAGSELSESAKRDLEVLLDCLGKQGVLDAQEAYVRLFDRSTRLSLYLYEHVHGESRDRGQAMVDLRAHYKSHGLTPTEDELPDYLPLFCEFLSVVDAEEARALLEEVAPLFALLAERVGQRKSEYASVFSALLELSGAQVDAAEVAKAAVSEELPTDESFDALDRVWAESEITFGAGDAHDSCDSAKRPAGSDLVQLRKNREQGAN